MAVSRRPVYGLQEQDPEFGVQPGSLKFGIGGPADTDYAQFRPVLPGRQAIPESLQGRSYLRPLLQGNSDGSPMSAADMESRAGAMSALDDFFTNGPMEQQLRESEGAAKLRQFEAAEQDPLYRERAKAQMEFDQKDALAQLSDMRRQHMLGQYSDELSQTQQRYQAAIERAKAAGNTALVNRLTDELEAQEGTLGARYGYMGEDQRNILFKGR